MNKPRRAYELEIRIGGDTWADVLRDVRDLANHIPEHGPACNSVSGGPDGNHIVTVSVDETMTHDRYFKELDAYLESTKEPKTPTPFVGTGCGSCRGLGCPSCCPVDAS